MLDQIKDIWEDAVAENWSNADIAEAFTSLLVDNSSDKDIANLVKLIATTND